MTRVLVVDDSALMRRLLGGLLGEAGFSVETARNGVEGVEKLSAWKPDVVTLDINMPEMDGLTALALMMETRPTPVVMVSSLTEKGAMATFEALALGAVDFVAKPGGTISLSIQSVGQDLIRKIRAAAGVETRSPTARLRGRTQAPVPQPAVRAATPQKSNATQRSAAPAAARTVVETEDEAPVARASRTETSTVPGLILIGVSTGGPRTLEDILPQLPADFSWAVVVAQHMPPKFTDAFARRMGGLCKLPVREVSATLPIERGHIYIGQGGTDVAVVERLGRLVVQPRPESPAHPWHPSVDVLVDSAMVLLRPHQLVGVLLTGMGDDGAEAMTRLHRAGGRTIAEDASSAVVFGMPRELIERKGASVVLSCTDVAHQLRRWVG